MFLLKEVVILDTELLAQEDAGALQEPGVSPRGITLFFSTPGSHRANVQRRPAFDKWNSTVSLHLNLEVVLGVSTRPWRRNAD